MKTLIIIAAVLAVLYSVYCVFFYQRNDKCDFIVDRLALLAGISLPVVACFFVIPEEISLAGKILDGLGVLCFGFSVLVAAWVLFALLLIFVRIYVGVLIKRKKEQ